MDGIRTEGLNVDFSVDIVMESKGTLTEDGYTVEVAIPLSLCDTKRAKGKLWGLQIFRVIQRFNGEQDSWMPISRDINGLLNQAGKITGLEGISTERTLELIPSLTVSETGKLLPHFNPIPNDPGRMVNEPIQFDLGLTATLLAESKLDHKPRHQSRLRSGRSRRDGGDHQPALPDLLSGEAALFSGRHRPLSVATQRGAHAHDYQPTGRGKMGRQAGRNSYGLMVAADRGPGTYIGDDRLDSFNFR